MLALTFANVAQTNDKNEGRFERAKVFAEVSAEEFGHTKEQQQELYKKKVQHYEESYVAKKKFKNGEIT